MRKENVFLVSGRQCAEDGDPRGPVKNCVVCGVDEKAVRLLLGEKAPKFWIISVTGLVMLEERSRRVKAVLKGEDKGWEVLIDPALSADMAA